MSTYPQKVEIIEVGPRDGLQSIQKFIPTDVKYRYITDLRQAGLSQIEATSFVNPKWVPQFSDAAALMAMLPDPSSFMVLVPNRQGVEAALASGTKRLAFFTAASETFNQKNINTTIDGSFERIKDAMSVLSSDDRRAAFLRVYVSTAFVCPYEGVVSPERVISVIDRALEMGADEISIGDTIGKATPPQVEALLTCVLARHPQHRFALHFHDTYGFALANVDAGLRMGITRYDSSAGGIGGCPYAPGASGNIATETLVRFLAALHIETGVDLDALVSASKRLLPTLS